MSTLPQCQGTLLYYSWGNSVHLTSTPLAAQRRAPVPDGGGNRVRKVIQRRHGESVALLSSTCTCECVYTRQAQAGEDRQRCNNAIHYCI